MTPANEYVSGLLKQNPLFVFAMPEEAKDQFDGSDLLFTGLGKINASYQLTKHLAQHRPGIIINLGSAGSSVFQQGDIICCTKFIQRDMDATALGFEKYKTPFSPEEPVFSYGIEIKDLPEGICGSGDSFDIAHGSKPYNVVDMEAYALALVAKSENIPFLCLKHITDGADEEAAANWEAALAQTPLRLKEIIDRLMV
jgi:adenosylhomocysteine nucleosidase